MLQNFPDLRAALAEKKGVKKFTLHCDMQTAHTPIRPIKKNAALRMEGGTNVTGCFPLYSLYPHMHDSTVAARIPACADNSLISGIFPLDLHSPAGTVFAAFPLARLFWRSRLGERL